MPETFNPLDGLSSFFFGKDKNDPRVNPAVRQKIALAMMARQGRFPKNIGEGLTAVGEAIGDRRLAQQLMDADIGQQDQVKELLGGPPAGAPAAAPPTGYAPPSPLASAPAVQAIDAATTPRPPPQRPPPPPVPAQPPPGFVGTQDQPPSMLSPNMPPPEMAGPEGQLATAPPPVQRSMMSPQPMLGPRMQTPSATEFNPAPVPPPGAAPPAAPPGGGGGLSAPPVDPNEVNSLDAQAIPASNNVQSWYEHARRPLALGGIGLTHPQASGLVANLQAESGPDIKPWGPTGDNGTAFGAAQWRNDRMNGNGSRQGLLTFAAARGLDPKATETQQAFMKYEFEGPEKGAYARLTAAQTPQDAATAMNRSYERSADVSGRRERTAAILANRLGVGGQPAPPAPPPQAPAMAFSGIQPAPPDPSSTIRPMPQSQLAQAQPAPVPGYVTPQGVAPSGAPIVPMHPEEDRIRKILRANPNNPYLPGQAAGMLEPYVREREQRQKEADEKYKSDLAAAAKQTEQHYKDRADQQKRIDEHAQAEQARVSSPASTATDPRLLGTPQSPQRTGIPTVPPVPPGVSPKEWGDKQTPELVKAVSTVEKATPKFRQMMDLIQQAENHPGKEWGVGPLSGVTGHFPSAAGFRKLMDQIGGQNFLNVYQQLKGGGSITEIEGTKAEAAQARLSTAQTKADFDKAMLDFKDAIRQDMESVQRKVNQPVTAWQRTPDDDPAPDIGQVGTFKGKTREYLGGNPALESSYRVVR